MENNYPIPAFNRVDVKVTYACNFACEYCYQIYNNERTKPALSKENAENLIKLAEKLKKDVGWYFFTLAGGEPFTYPHLNYLGEELAKLEHKISIISNFTAELDKIQSFVQTVGKQMGNFAISVHLSQWENIENFYAKFQSLHELYDSLGVYKDFILTCVITEENYLKAFELEEEVKKRFGLQVNLQRYYGQGHIYKIYSDEVEKVLKEKGIDVPQEKANNIDHKGKLCWSGMRDIYIESDGTVKRCYTRQVIESCWNLGNLSDYENIRIFDKPTPCLSADGKCVAHQWYVRAGYVLDV